MILAWLLCATGTSHAQSTYFSFTLDEPCKTSAGVFTPDGTLIRTLWSKVRYYAPGTYSAVWDGLEDSFDGNSNMAPAGTYQIRLLEHNTEYVWDGAIGNTSAEVSGPTVHFGFWPMRDMAISGTNAFYVSAYDEGKYDFRSFLTTDPQHVKAAWYWVATPNGVSSVPGDIYDLNWRWVTADANWVYFACSGTPNPANPSTNKYDYPGCIVACNVSDNSPAYFTYGMPITNIDTNEPLPNGIYVGTQTGLSGLSVQQNGNLLAVSVAPDNLVYLLDKRTGAAINSFYAYSPGRLNFSPDGSLWVICGNYVVCYTNVGSSPSVALGIPNFSEPLDVAVNPTNADLILVADGGASQQVKAFDSTGTPLWTYGLAGGYPANGVAVATNKFWFSDGENGDGTFVCFAPDGSFWVEDGGNNRCLHFSATCDYIEQIMYQPHSYMTSVDQNNPSRVFNGFLEFSVDYTKPLQQSWALVSNWMVNVPSINLQPTNPTMEYEGYYGIYEVTTFTNGRTYALINNYQYYSSNGNYLISQLCELVPNQLRLTTNNPAWGQGKNWISFGPDGSARRTSGNGDATWYETTLGGFDSSNNPIWNPETTIASASAGSTDPVPRYVGFGNIRATISTNNILISFDQSTNYGWHLGGVRVGGTDWLWKASPAVAFMDGRGTYEISNGVQYAGNTLQAVDRNVIYGYHGEDFRSEGQAGQTMHFYDDGLFVGQFGEASPGHNAYEGAFTGFAGNGQCPNLIKTATGDYYVWVNDESDHGPQRWHLVNARNIREQIGSGPLGGTITLTNQNYGFPAGVAGKGGNQTAELWWLPVPGAAFYNIYYSLMNGGPYSIPAGSTTNLDYVIGGLTNGQTYYFAVTAIQAVEGIPSGQVAITPFDTSQSVLCAGSMSEGGQLTPIVEVSTNPPTAGQPGYIGELHLSGLLDPRELDYYGFGNLENESVGCDGYLLYDWEGYGTRLTNMAASITVEAGPGWHGVTNLTRQYEVGTVLGVNCGWAASNALASLNILVSDTNFHFLTVVSPAQYNNPRQFSLQLTSTNGASAVYNVNESIGYSHVFQYLFSGNATLYADAGEGGTNAIVQSVFLDDAPVTSLPASLPSSMLPALTGAAMPGNGAFQFSFSNMVSQSITVLSTTNLLLAPANWTVVWGPSNVAPGLFQFTAQPAAGGVPGFYMLRSP
jgi:hypothetical protein